MTRKDLRKMINDSTLSLISENNDDYKSEMTEFSETKSGKGVMTAGSRIKSAGKSIRGIALEQTGRTRSTLDSVSSFVEKLGEALENLNSLDEGGSTSAMLPTVAEFKKMIKELQKLEK